MDPSETGVHYDEIAAYWQEHVPPTYGMAQLERALKFCKIIGPALDVGCGSEGRFLRVLRERGFAPEGLDISPGMIALVRNRHPDVPLHVADICRWELPKKYAFISAWDSTFHLPLNQQGPVLRKICDGLAPGGVLIFTCGGGVPGEITGSFAGQDFGYSTLGVETFVRLLEEGGCFCRHVEYDQYPEEHVYVIAEKIGPASKNQRTAA